MKVIALGDHPREDALTAYVSDTLDQDQADTLEAHVFDCALCAARLERAAHFQMLLHEAAVELDPSAPVPAASPARRRWRASAMGGLWAAAAAVVLMVCQQGSHVDVEADPARAPAGSPSALAAGATSLGAEDSGSDGLLASVDPLESVDPLQTWPGDPFTDPSWDPEEPLDGEPCGSGEDGGPLVCQPFSG